MRNVSKKFAMLDRFFAIFPKAVFMLTVLLLPSLLFAQAPDTLWTEDWESGIGIWSASRGVWDVGPPTSGPDSAYAGLQCAATVPNGSYPDGADSRLGSPSIDLTIDLQENEVLQLRFWHWFLTWSQDPGFVEISVNDGPFKPISGTFSFVSGGWTHFIADISTYADSTIQLGFRFTSDNDGFQRPGWYIDEISIVKGVFSLTDSTDFEEGTNNWFADKGVWQIGTPTSGPMQAFNGEFCAATVLDSDYPPGANSRLISPEITLTPKMNESPLLCFRHWFLTWNQDPGNVQISVEGRPWETISPQPISGDSQGWTQICIDLSAYADSTVRLGFLFASDNDGFQRPGWYVDSLRILNVLVTDVDENESSIPAQFSIQQNYPNPFNPSTTIQYELQTMRQVTLKIYNVLGQKINTLVDELQAPGFKSVIWDGNDSHGRRVASGIYIYRIAAGEDIKSKKMVLIQ